MSTVHFNKGDIIKCPKGHYICEVNRDVYVGEVCDVSIFVNFKETKEPKLGDPIESCVCSKCGANWAVRMF